jgi:hypothetical protein
LSNSDEQDEEGEPDP